MFCKCFILHVTTVLPSEFLRKRTEKFLRKLAECSLWLTVTLLYSCLFFDLFSYYFYSLFFGGTISGELKTVTGYWVLNGPRAANPLQPTDTEFNSF